MDQDPVRLLASLFRAHQQARPILLLGAGASFSSGIPVAAECVKRIARRVYAERVVPGGVLVERVKVSEWQDWLRRQPWFIEGEDRLAENFPLVVQHLLTPQEYKREVLLDLMSSKVPPGRGYGHLAEFMTRSLVTTVLTTNFDRCIPEALRELGSSAPRLTEVNKSPGDLKTFDVFPRAQLIWLHGTAEHYTDRNLLSETLQLDQQLVLLLHTLLGSSPVVVIGYRGAEPSVTEHLLGDPGPTGGFKRGLFWCIRRGEKPHPSVEALRRKVGDNFRFVEIDGFDEVMDGLAGELEGEDRYPFARPRPSPSTAEQEVPFDDQPLLEASAEDLDEDLMLSTMVRYCEVIGRAPVNRSSLPALLAEQQLLVSVGNRTVPTRGCVLLFGREPQKFMHHAVVETTIGGKKRTVVSGNLLAQRDALLAWLDGKEVNPVLRVKARTAHQDRRAVPELALVELAINALVHRDYAIQETVTIDAAADGGIRFTSPGALLPAIARRVRPDAQGRFQPVRLQSEQRNRSLCDIFFGLRHMQRAGTGLADVEDLTRGTGGQATFRSDAEAARFEARVSAPAASGGSREVARDGREFATYIINTLPFVTMPDTLTTIQLRGPFKDRPGSVDLSDAGTFATIDGHRIVSFVPLPILRAVFGDYCIAYASAEVPVAEIALDAVGRDHLSWLLRRHFEQHLRGLRDRGILLESELPGRRNQRRAYFVGEGSGKPRDLVYDTPARRNVRRQVVKARGEDGRRAWFENEGFSYAVVGAADGWGIRLKPFYMFTGGDARTPLPPAMQGSRSTRRIKFDRNKNVEDDLTFWGRLVGRGQPVVDVGQQHVGDLLLQGTFLTLEVPVA